MIFSLIAMVMAREVAVKVHDREGVLAGPLSVEVQDDGKLVSLKLADDGVDPDGVAGDHLYTAKVELSSDSGKIRVSAGGKSWEGPYLFEENSDAVILVGLEGAGKASTSTHEVMFFPDQQGKPPPSAGPAPAPANPNLASNAKERPRAAEPKGLWLGYGVLGAIFAGLGAIAWTRKAPRLPTLNRIPRSTFSHKGPYEPSTLTDLWVGGTPEKALGMSPGPWTPVEIALAALAVGGIVRVVVGDPKEVDGDFEGLQKVLEGRAALLWISTEGPPS